MLNEPAIIDYIAAQEASIDGIKDSFGYAKNPDNISRFPCVVHFIGSFQMKPLAHHNVWDEALKCTSVVFVRPRQTQAGKLAYLENDAIPFGYKWRQKFQDETVLRNALATMGARRAWLESGNYGSGGAILQYAGVDYIGWIMQFNIASA